VELPVTARPEHLHALVIPPCSQLAVWEHSRYVMRGVLPPPVVVLTLMQLMQLRVRTDPEQVEDVIVANDGCRCGMRWVQARSIMDLNLPPPAIVIALVQLVELPVTSRPEHLHAVVIPDCHQLAIWEHRRHIMLCVLPSPVAVLAVTQLMQLGIRPHPE